MNNRYPIYYASTPINILQKRMYVMKRRNKIYWKQVIISTKTIFRYPVNFWKVGDLNQCNKVLISKFHCCQARRTIRIRETESIRIHADPDQKQWPHCQVPNCLVGAQISNPLNTYLQPGVPRRPWLYVPWPWLFVLAVAICAWPRLFVLFEKKSLKNWF